MPRVRGDALRIRRATAADEGGVLDLLRASLGEGTVPRTAAYWRWKHVDNPFGASPVLVAEDDGRIVGLRAFMRWTFHDGARPLPAVRAVDTATHPEYQGQGIFKRLTLQLRDEMGREGAAFVFNTPNAQSRPGYLKMGWSLVGRPTLWARAVRPARLVRALRGGGPGGAEQEAPPIRAASVGEVLAQPGVHALVQAASRPSRRIHTAPDSRVLQWRYANVPGFRYAALHRGDGEGGALVILRARQRGELRELRICDTLVGPTREARANLGALLRQVPRVSDADVVLAIASGRPSLQRALLASAFVPVPRAGPILTTYPLPASTSAPDPRRLAHWAATIGDLELF
jgi:GNAT superfamily N-acetyltransferase